MIRKPRCYVPHNNGDKMRSNDIEKYATQRKRTHTDKQRVRKGRKTNRKKKKVNVKTVAAKSPKLKVEVQSEPFLPKSASRKLKPGKRANESRNTRKRKKNKNDH